MSKKVATTIEELVKPVIEEDNLELVDVNYTKEGGRWFLRLYIDKPGGVGLEDCEFISQKVEKVIDEHDPISNSYTLEVSSPGLDRPLKKISDFEKFQGHNVNVSTYAPINGQRRFKGVLQGVTGQDIKLSVNNNEVVIPLEQVAKAKLNPEIEGPGG